MSEPEWWNDTQRPPGGELVKDANAEAGDLMIHGVLNMPLPPDPSKLGVVEWIQFRDRARQASARILELEADNAMLREELGK